MGLLRDVIRDPNTLRLLYILGSIVGMLAAVWIIARWELQSK